MGFKLFIGLLLTPFSLIFGCVVAIRRFLYRKGILRSKDSPVSAIDIGNLAVGGTGKTPHTQYVINLLKQDFQVAVLSRGYGRKSKGYHSVLRTDSQDRNAEMFGDEPYMTHLRFPDIPLAVDGDRLEGVQNLLSESPETEVFVLDDAYQHLSFRPSYHILLTEFEHPYFEDAPMPSGRLREFPCAAKDADTVIVTKVPDDVDVDVFFWRERLKLTLGQQLFFTRFRYEKPVAMTDAAKKIPLDEVSSGNLLTGIAHPKPLLAHLKKKYRIEKHFDFPDHHSYTVKDIESIYNQHFADDPKRCVLFTTEKDWMRLQSDHIRNIVSLLPVFVIPVEVEFLTDTQRDTFNQMLKDHVRRKKN